MKTYDIKTYIVIRIRPDVGLEFECDICHKISRLSLPLSVAEVVERGRGFILKHKKCKEVSHAKE